MSIDDICHCIDQAAGFDGFREIGISGGEPFLFLEHLSRITSFAATRGFSVAVTSNAFWASSERHAYTLLSDLHTKGLRCLNISMSPFHLEFITPQKICNAVSAALQLQMKTRVNCVYTRSFGVDDVQRLLGEFATDVEIVRIPCLPTGRAAQQVPLNEFPVRNGIPLGACRQHFTKLAVTAEGDVFPCCSPGGFTEPLRVGNVHKRALSEIIANMADNPLLQVLSTVGPAFFVPFIRKALSAEALAGPFVDQCHLCHTIMSDDVMSAVVQAALRELERELAELHLNIAVLAGEETILLATSADENRINSAIPVGVPESARLNSYAE